MVWVLLALDQRFLLVVMTALGSTRTIVLVVHDPLLNHHWSFLICVASFFALGGTVFMVRGGNWFTFRRGFIWYFPVSYTASNPTGSYKNTGSNPIHAFATLAQATTVCKSRGISRKIINILTVGLGLFQLKLTTPNLDRVYSFFCDVHHHLLFSSFGREYISANTQLVSCWRRIKPSPQTWQGNCLKKPVRHVAPCTHCKVCSTKVGLTWWLWAGPTPSLEALVAAVVSTSCTGDLGSKLRDGMFNTSTVNL